MLMLLIWVKLWNRGTSVRKYKGQNNKKGSTFKFYGLKYVRNERVEEYGCPLAWGMLNLQAGKQKFTIYVN
jgi:hypothetical protein